MEELKIWLKKLLKG